MLLESLLQPPPRSMRLDTLIRLRWLAVIGQISAVLVVYFGLEFDLPIWPCLGVIGLSVCLNVVLRLRFQSTQRFGPERAAALLGFDIAELSVLLFLTGGLQNPFALMLLGPVLISATTLPPRLTVTLGLVAVLCATLLVFFHLPLPWDPDEIIDLPPVYMVGLWLAQLLAIGYIGIYTWQTTEEARKLSDALAATELVLAREQHISQLDGLAAAAAHELGTPLSTILLTSRELERELGPNDPRFNDVKLLREQAQRCRGILAKLTQLSSEDEPFGRMPLSSLIEEVVAPHRDFGVAIDVLRPQDRADEPTCVRNPGILYGLGNLLENAVDFARERVEVAAAWDANSVAVTIADDGPGFAPEVIARLGEPYVRTRRLRRRNAGGDTPGLGLGLFIAKTLLERSGAVLAFRNRVFPDHGAIIEVSWKRGALEQPAGPAQAAADSPSAPSPLEQSGPVA